ncbi:MAG: hypothetical protein ACXWXU_05470 [Solirubrobacterales bacterium]
MASTEEIPTDSEKRRDEAAHEAAHLQKEAELGADVERLGSENRFLRFKRRWVLIFTGAAVGAIALAAVLVVILSDVGGNGDGNALPGSALSRGEGRTVHVVAKSSQIILHQRSAPAGGLTFIVHNVGLGAGELNVARVVNAGSTGIVLRHNATDPTSDIDIAPGDVGTLKLRLNRGSYLLYAVSPDHVIISNRILEVVEAKVKP